KSGLRDLEFLTDYNEFPLQDFAFSQNTRTAYVHYTYPVPSVNIPGNYVLAIYRDGNENDLILTHRFMVVQNKVGVVAKLERSQMTKQREEMQRITVDLDYSALEIPNPMTQLKVVVRQNRRWDQLAIPSPTQIRQGQQRMVYAPLDEQLDFAGGNEFRWFETRNLNFAGQNVNNIVLKDNSVQAFLTPERSRGGLAYGQIPDLNGAYQPRIQGDFGKVEGDYLQTNFLLLTDSLPGDIYVVGAFNHWQANRESRLRYNAKEKGYTGNMLLKQGWYNYQFMYKGDPTDPWLLEGSHFATENRYEIIVYYRPLGSIQDQLIGYTQLQVNPF
ncbi:MAG: type IX secretion system plug protein domain-containing protein, partial [Bacteroidota bacterium]